MIETIHISQLLTERAELRQQLQEAQDNLRDKFAMAALQGILNGGVRFKLRGDLVTYAESKVAEMSYIFADAMIKARKVSE